ncbi:MAG: type II toxin-antitoxin system ParD family antitoxin [Thermosynechococcaceae cyanobacterium]
MSITLNLEQETIVAQLVETGSFKNANEVLQVALKLLEAERESYQAWLSTTQAQVKEGIESLDRGEGIEGTTVVNDLLAQLRQTQAS